MPIAGPERRPGKPVIADDEVARELDRIEHSAAFLRSAQLRRLLRHLVLHAQQQNALGLKEIALGIEALGRDPGTFDPKSDPIVRVEVRRLRAKLLQYYAAEGREAAFEIDLPTGSYVPVLRRRIPREAVAVPSIAVLPFANFTGDPAHDAFCDALTDELIDALARVPGLRVVARTSAFRFKGHYDDARAIGHALDVATLLEGSVQVVGPRLKLIVQLVLAADGGHVWSQVFETEWSDVFAVQEAVAGDVVRSLLRAQALDGNAAGSADPRSLMRRGTRDPQARDLADRAVMIARTLDVARYPVARQLLEQALAQDPGYARAHGLLALLKTNQIAVAARSATDAIASARPHLTRALALDPDLAQSRALGAWIVGTVERDWSGALRECQRAVRAAPGDAGVRNTFGSLLTYVGRFAEAGREFDLARELDPLNIVPRANYALMLCCARRYQDAIAEYRAILDLDSEQQLALVMISALLMSGRCTDALAMAEDWSRRHPAAPAVIARHAEALAAVGRVDDAEARFAAGRESLAAVHVGHWARAHLDAVLRNWDAALRELDAAGAAGEGNFETAAVAPYFAPLHVDPRWSAFIARHRLPQVPADAWQ